MSKKEILKGEIPSKAPQGELTDAFTGELFQARARNHYEENDGVPFAPPVDFPRPTIRQRIENLTNRGVNTLAHYVGTEGIDMDVPDEPDAPLTPSEMNYIDLVAAQVAEDAPLPDEGLPRQPDPTPPVQAAPAAAVAPPGATGGSEATGPK